MHYNTFDDIFYYFDNLKIDFSEKDEKINFELELQILEDITKALEEENENNFINSLTGEELLRLYLTNPKYKNILKNHKRFEEIEEELLFFNILNN